MVLWCISEMRMNACGYGAQHKLDLTCQLRGSYQCQYWYHRSTFNASKTCGGRWGSYQAVLISKSKVGGPAQGNSALGVNGHLKPRVLQVAPTVRAPPLLNLLHNDAPKLSSTKTVSGCGVSITGGGDRIVGGSEVVPHSLPWQVALAIDYSSFCGGAIISEDWILTAASCVDNAQHVEVIAGAHNLTKREDSQVIVKSFEFIVHEHWDGPHHVDNIALIHLPTPLQWTPAISPVCLPSHSDRDLEIGTLVTPSGWGTVGDGWFFMSHVLNQVTVPVMDNEVCYNAYHGYIVPSTICTDSKGGKGICTGDTGGPLNYVREGVTYIRGITSFTAAGGCESGYPDAYTRVNSYLQWIQDNTGIIISP